MITTQKTPVVRKFLSTWLVVQLLTIGISANAAGTNHALVIGINDYQNDGIQDLTTAVNDVSAFADILHQQYGYSTTVLTDENATKKHIYTSFSELRRKVTPDDNVIIYFAGHGEVDDVGAYWLPYDAEKPGVVGAEADWIPSSLVRDNLAAFSNRHVLIISDSCFAGGLISTRSAGGFASEQPGWIDKVNSKKSRWILASGSNEPVADTTEISSDHSVFAFFLIDALKSMGDRPFTVQDLSNDVQRNVANNAMQTPRANAMIGAGDLGGQMVFQSNNAKGAVMTTSPTQYRAQSPTANMTKRPRTTLTLGLSTLGLAAVQIAIASWAKSEYTGATDPSQRERMKQMNYGFGYSGIGFAVIGTGLTTWALIPQAKR